MARKRRKTLPPDPVAVEIQALAQDGRGTATVDGRTVFIRDVLAGERVRFRYTARRRDFDVGEVDAVLEASAERVEPRCPHVGVCGGCALQHMHPQAQLAFKQQLLLDHLQRIGEVSPAAVVPPLSAEPWAYRRRARLSARHVPRKHRTLVGFRERQGRYVADLQQCHVLTPEVGLRIAELGTLLDRLDARATIPQIEIAAGDHTTALVIRHMEPLSSADRAALRQFETRTALRIVLQSGGPDSLAALSGRMPELSIAVPGDLTLYFGPNNFVQVNAALNAPMIELALDKLDLRAGHRVLDLFCGLGNFTLPIARQVAQVEGIEGDQALVELAGSNARRNGMHNAAFREANLYEPVQLERCDRVLLDPPRSGALEVLPAVAGTGAQRLVYISCNPETLARDAGVLVHQLGFKLIEAGVMDMFPHTTHMESIAVFQRADGRT